MIAIQFTDIKKITEALFLKETFDNFSLYEAAFTTHSNFIMDGSYQKDFDSDYSEPYVSWHQMRPICFQIIKGKKLPLQFKVILRLSEVQKSAFVAKHPSDFKEADVESLHFIIQYRNGNLTLTTGSSYKIFTMDKTLDQHFDTMVLRFLDKTEIPYRIS